MAITEHKLAKARIWAAIQQSEYKHVISFVKFMKFIDTFPYSGMIAMWDSKDSVLKERNDALWIIEYIHWLQDQVE